MVPLNNAAWSFKADPADRGLERGWQNGSFTGEPVTLPHITDARTTDRAYQGSVGWYRARIEPPKAASGASWELRFEQVRRIADVWIDGRRAGGNRSSYEPFVVPAARLSDSRPHTIVVRADNRLQSGRRPDGWWNWGGITRAVTLAERGDIAVRDTGLMPERRCDAAGDCNWTVLTDVTVENHGRRTLRPQITAALTAPGGDPAGRAGVMSRPLAPGESARVRFRVPVEGKPRLWSRESPARYLAAISASAPGALGPRATDEHRIGLRTVRVVDGILYLNGRAIELRGASIHEDVPGRGPAMTDADVNALVKRLDAIGANVTRAHYALDQRLLDRLDEEGILVWSQAPVYHRDNELETAAGRAEMLGLVRSAVIQTRNHPAVITHSVANELSTHPDERKGTGMFLRQARELTTDLDPTLPTALDVLSYPGLERQRAHAAFDMLGVNTYFGWYEGRDGHSTAELETLVPFVREMRQWYPASALVMTEFGAEATENGPASRKQTNAFQSRYIDETLDLAGELPQLSGAIYWTLQEFAVKPDWDGGAQDNVDARDSIHHKGVLTHDGRRKPGWETLREQIAAIPFERSAREIELATGIPQPSASRGRLGGLATLILIITVVAVLILDLIALIAWRRHVHDHEDELIEAALAVPVPEPVPALAVLDGGGEGDDDASRVA